MDLSGLGSVYSGYQSAQTTDIENQKNQAAAQEAAFKLLGAQVLGRALAGNQPMAPPPGQPSQPAAAAIPREMNGIPMSQPRPQGAPGGPAVAPPTPAAATPTGMPELSLESLTQRILQTTPQVRNNPQVLLAALERAAPILDRQSKADLLELRQAIQQQALQTRVQIADANREATNVRADNAERGRTERANISAEARRYTSDSLLRARELSTNAQRDIAQLSSDTRREIAERAEIGRTDRAELSANARQEIARLNTDTRREIVALMEAGRDSRAATASEDRRYATDTRAAAAAAAEQGRTDRATLAEQGRNERAAAVESGRSERHIQTMEMRQALTRMSAAAQLELEAARHQGRLEISQLSSDTRRELASLNNSERRALAGYLEQGRNTRAAAAEDGRNSRAAATQAGQNDRATARNERTDRRLDQTDRREARLAAAAQVRQDQAWQRLETQKADLQRKIEAGDRGAAVTQLRAIIDAQHKRAGEVLAANSANNMMTPADRKALLDEQQKLYDEQVTALRNLAGRATLAQPKVPDRVAPNAPIVTQPAAPDSVPTATGPNGQKLYLRNGQWTTQ